MNSERELLQVRCQIIYLSLWLIAVYLVLSKMNKQAKCRYVMVKRDEADFKTFDTILNI